MTFTVILTEEAVQYGMSNQSAGLGSGLQSIIGTEVATTTSWGAGQLSIEQSGTITVGYSAGFSLALTFTMQSAATATITEVDLLSPLNEPLITYSGPLPVASSTFSEDLSDANALSGNDTIKGNSAANVLEGYGGDDYIDGGAGVDTAILRGSRSLYSVVLSPNVVKTSGPDGTDTLVQVERVRFDDAGIAFDTAGNAGEAYRLYQAAFNRVPDEAGLGYWINRLDHGASLNDVSQGFVTSSEFGGAYAGLDDLLFVHILYQNVLHRQGEEGGINYWTGHLVAHELTRAQVLAFFSESPENQAAVIGVISSGIAYVPIG